MLIFDADARPSRLTLLLNDDELGALRAETGSVEDTGRVKSLVREAGVTHILHLAATLMPHCQQNPVHGGLVNVIGTLNVFEAARDAGRPVRVVYASSAAVWGPEEVYGSGLITEEDPLRPATHYGVFKQANEGNARVFYSTNGISSVGLRPWTVYGVGRDQGLTADPTLAMRAVARGEAFQVRLSGRMDLQYVGDVAETFVACLESDLEGAHVFNLRGDVVEMSEFIALLGRLRPGAAARITASGPQVPVAYRIDDAGLRAHFPRLPRTALEDGVRETIERFEALK